MASQKFNFQTDFMNNLERPVIYIAKKDKTIIGSTINYEALSLTFNMNAFNTASFSIYEMIDGKIQSYYKDFQEDMLILIHSVSWYKIHVEETIDLVGRKKNITATSLECTLCNKRLINFEVNTDDQILDEDFVTTIFYDVGNPSGSLLHKVLSVAPNWKIGHVDACLSGIDVERIGYNQRTFDVSDQDVYSFLTNDVAEAFEVLFVFDTFNMTVNAYNMSKKRKVIDENQNIVPAQTYGDNTNIFVSIENLAKNMTVSVDENSIYTCLKVVGGDGVYINEISPNGTDRIYNFEYYLPQMDENLRTKVQAYNSAYNSKFIRYEDIMSRMHTSVVIIQELKSRLPDNLNSTDWTQYGLDMLASKKKSYENINQIYVTNNYNNPTSLNYNSYLENKQLLSLCTNEYNVRLSQIAMEEANYYSIKQECSSLQSELNMNEWFTEDEWKALDSYVNEQVYTNDNYSVTDLTDDSERFNIERQLFDIASDDLAKMCRPQYQYSSTLSNVLCMKEFEHFRDSFALGNFITMETNYDTHIMLRLISFTVNFDNTEKLPVVFSDAQRVHDCYDDTASIQSQVNSTVASFQFNKDQYNKAVKNNNYVEQLRQYGLNTAITRIFNAENQSQIWDESGMSFREWNTQSNSFSPEQIKIINNEIVFTDNSWESAKMAIGKLDLGSGETAYGVNAEVILGKLLMGNNLYLENDSGTFRIDANGFSATNGTNSIYMNPSNPDELFALYKGTTKQLYFDSNGNAHFKGDISGSTGTFSGNLSGGSIDIGNGTFVVDYNGNITANSGTFGGTLNGATGTFNGELRGNRIIGSTIVGGTISIGENFSVDSNGIVAINHGYIHNEGEVGLEDWMDCILSNSGLYIRGKERGGIHWKYVSTFSSAGLSITGANAIDGNITSLIGINSEGCTFAFNNIDKFSVTRSGVKIDGYDPITSGNISSQRVARADNAYNADIASNLYGGGAFVYVSSNGHLRADSDGQSACGTYYARWTQVWACVGEINTSDKREKHNISSLTDKHFKFLKMIQPKSFEFNNGTSGRKHIGFISQEIEQAMIECDIDSLDFAGFIKTPIYSAYKQEKVNGKFVRTDEPTDDAVIVDYSYGLRYSEFISLICYGWQRTENKLDNLISKLTEQGILTE